MAELIERDPLALVMFAAWVNLPVDKLPPEMRGHTCQATMEAWARVAAAARARLAFETACVPPPPKDLREVIERVLDKDASNG
jgi:hypothetical protein